MIVRELRKKHKWSQEQLADLSGLNVRTIQRVESGNKASIETLKCLASVFEIDILKLTEEITVINKESENWKELPLWFRINMCGIGTRNTALYIEFVVLFAALLGWFIAPAKPLTPILFLVAYLQGWLVRYGDRKEVW